MYHDKYDPYQKENVLNGIITRLPVVNMYMTRPEAIEHFGRKWGPVLYERLKPQKYDNVKLELLKIEGGRYVKDLDKNDKPKIMTLREIKDSFAAINLATTEPNKLRHLLGSRFRHFMKIPGTMTVPGRAGLLNEYIKRAQEIYRKGGDINNLGEILEVNKKTIPIIGHGRTPFATKHILEAEAEALDTMMFRFYMKELIGPLEYMLNMYTTVSNGTAKHITKYIQQWSEYILYGKIPEAGLLDGQAVADTVDFMNRMNSFNKIMFSFKTQGMNLGIGQVFNIIREPGAYRRGMLRFAKNPKKAVAMAKRFGLANIVDDAIFGQLDKEVRMLGVNIKKIEDVGYSFMEYAEKLNQFPVFLGLMTEKEYNAYDSDAELVSPEDMLTNWRRRMILWRVQDIHGDYRKIALAPWWITNQGRATMQFKKWLPALIWSHFAPYHIDKNLMVRSGIVPTIKLSFKIIAYNSKPVAKRQAKLAEYLEREASGDTPHSPEYFKNAQDYFETIVKEMNGNRIKFKELSENDKSNLRAALTIVLFQALFTLATMALTKGSDDDDQYRKFAIRNFLPILKRFNGDVFWIYTMENWQYFFENIVPSVSLLVDASAFFIDLAKWNTYKKDTLSADKGFPKFIIDATYFIPAGSFVRWLNQKARIRVWKGQKVDLYELGVDQTTLDLLGLDSPIVSKFDIKEAAYKYGKMYKMINAAYEYDYIMNSGMNVDEYYDLLFGERLLKQERNLLNDALNGMRLEYMYENGQFGDMDEIAKKYKAMMKVKNQKEKRRDKQTEKEFNEALEKNN
jgi:hypothetical protein